MNSKRWTPTEIDRLLTLHRQGFGCREVAAMLSGRGENAIRIKLLSLGYSSARPAEADLIERPTISNEVEKEVPGSNDVFRQACELRARRELEAAERRAEERDIVKDAKRELLEEKILEEFRRTLCDIPRPLILGEPPKISPAAECQSAVLVLSDLHAGKVIDPEEIEGFGAYNPAITMARVRHLEIEVLRILHSRPVKKLYLLFAGDIVEGQLGHAVEDDLTVPVALQIDLATNLLFPFLCGISRAVPHIEVHGVPGNHGRWPLLRKMPSVRRWSNLDTIVYGALAALCRHAGTENIDWDERISSRRIIDADGFRLQLLHGDEVRGGPFAASGMAKEVANTTMRHLQAGRPAPTYYVMGDKHTSASLPFGRGSFIVNGSFVGTDAFGMGFAPAPPSQTLFFLQTGVGRTETHEIHLGQAALPHPLPYDLKPSLQQLIERYL